MNPFDLNLNFRVLFSPGASGRVGEIAQMYKARQVETVEAGHPVPDDCGLEGARRMLNQHRLTPNGRGKISLKE